jgi:hypothetical protein
MVTKAWETEIRTFLDDPVPREDGRAFEEVLRLRLRRDMQNLLIVRHHQPADLQRLSAVPRLQAVLGRLLDTPGVISNDLLCDPFFQFHLQCISQIVLQGGETASGGRLDDLELQDRMLHASCQWLDDYHKKGGARDSGRSQQCSPEWPLRIMAGDNQMRQALRFVCRGEDKYVLVDHDELDTAAQAIQNGIGEIAAVWPPGVRELIRWVKVILPVSQRRHGLVSFTIRRWMIGAVFLTAEEQYPLFVQEALIHEACHSVLDSLQALDPLVTIGEHGMYEMPWSGNRRTLEEYLHGTYVYFVLGHFFLAARELRSCSELVRQRLNHLTAGLPEAIQLLKRHPALTPVGRRLVESFDRHTEELLRGTGSDAKVRGIRIPTDRFYRTLNRESA